MDLLKLKAKISLDSDEYNKGLDDAETKAKTMGGGIGKALGSVAKVTAAATSAAVGAAATGIGILVKQSVSAYAEYEQLAGGVETLFKDSSDKVMEYASNAYKTAGLSANEYMETVTSFSASLLQSLGGDTEAAAEYADKAITDMSDNANKMGTSMESIQNAYQGFAKQNYTMLDNLKLGYGGTKEEMERLLADAEKLSGQKFDLSSYADIVEAIHVVQTEMGITGTTAEEASSTIQGSLGMLKSSWENLVAGFADPNADLGLLIDNMIDSAVIAIDNLLPAIERALSGIAAAIEKLVPIISEKLPKLAEDLLPPLLRAAGSLVEGIVKALPAILKVLMAELPKIINDIVTTLLNMLPEIIDVGLQIIEALALGIADSLPELIPTIVDVILKIVDVLIDHVDELVDASIAIILALAEGLIKALPKLLEKAPEIVEKLVQAIVKNMPKLVGAAGQLIIALVKGLITNYPKIIQAGWEILGSLVSGIINNIGKMSEAGGKVISKFGDSIKSALHNAGQWGRDLIDSFVNGILGSIGKVISAVTNVANSVRSRLHFSEPDEGPLADFHTYAPDMMNLFMKGINDNKNKLARTVEDAFDFEDIISNDLPTDISSNISINGNKQGFAGMATGNFTINVYPKDNDTARDIVDEIQYRIAQNVNREKAVWAL